MIGAPLREQNGTILLATPTFLRTYIRRCEPADFATLEVVITGAEKLPAQLADEFEAKFGLRPLEGYGTTEISPLVSVNIPPEPRARPAGAFGAGRDRRQAAAGRPVKVVDPETGEDLAPGERGDAAGQGAERDAGLPEPAGGDRRRSLRDGWYVTGDIGAIDADGFITITGRLSRVRQDRRRDGPARAGRGDADEDRRGRRGGHARRVVSVPDPERGERLVVVHTLLEQSPAELRDALHAAGLPNLFIPDGNSFLCVEQLPTLGTGKLDIRAIKRMAGTAFR